MPSRRKRSGCSARRMEETGANLRWGIASFASRDGPGPGAADRACYSMARRDIAERRRAEGSVRGSEERVRLLLESTGEGIYGIDLDGRCTFCNPACVHLLGYATADDLLGKEMHPLIHHTRPDGTPLAAATAGSARPCAWAPWRTSATRSSGGANGTSFPTEYRSHPIYRGGRADRRRRHLRRHHPPRPRRGGDAAPRPGTEGNRTGHPDLGPGAAREPGHLCQRSVRAADRLSRSEVKGQNCRFLQGPGTDPATHRGACARRSATARDCAVEILNYRKDGTPFWNALAIAPVQDADGGSPTSSASRPTSPSGSGSRKSCGEPRSRPRRPAAPRARSWPT